MPPLFHPPQLLRAQPGPGRENRPSEAKLAGFVPSGASVVSLHSQLHWRSWSSSPAALCRVLHAPKGVGPKRAVVHVAMSHGTRVMKMEEIPPLPFIGLDFCNLAFPRKVQPTGACADCRLCLCLSARKK